MAKGKEMEAILKIVGNLDPSLQKAVTGATKIVGGIGKGMAVAGTAVVAGMAAATAATVGTFGAGVVTYGGAVVVTAYGTNNIANRLTDIFNRWDGDSSNDSEIGNVNYLKSGLTNGIGYLGESIGGETGRAVGETIGKAVYATGEVYSALASAKTYEAGIEGVAKMAGTDSVIGKVVNSQVGRGAMKIAVDKLGLSINEGEYVADAVDGAIKIAGGDGLSERAYDYLSKSVDTALDIKDYATSYDSFMKSGGELSDVISNSYSSVDSLIEVSMIR